MKEGTLYFCLKWLEKNELIYSYWSDEQVPGRRRKYYNITPL
ncbi:helix-turn-helix transcriptional regulator [Paenibacillus sp. FSL R7-0302]